MVHDVKEPLKLIRAHSLHGYSCHTPRDRPTYEVDDKVKSYFRVGPEDEDEVLKAGMKSGVTKVGVIQHIHTDPVRYDISFQVDEATTFLQTNIDPDWIINYPDWM